MTALDQADLWLMQNDPELRGKSAKYLLNKKIRNAHCLGSEFFDEELTDNREESQDHEAFFKFIENQHWLNPEVKILVLGISQDQSLAKIGQSLGGISKQAVYKRLHKHKDTIQYLLKIWNGKNNPPPPSRGNPYPILWKKTSSLRLTFLGVRHEHSPSRQNLHHGPGYSCAGINRYSLPSPRQAS